jgi:hypothetical protein
MYTGIRCFGPREPDANAAEITSSKNQAGAQPTILAACAIAICFAGCHTTNEVDGGMRLDSGHGDDSAIQDAAIDVGEGAPPSVDASPDSGPFERDAASGGPDASTGCVFASGECIGACIEYHARRYDRTRMCMESVYEVVGCARERDGLIDDPECVVKRETGEIYRVPYSFLEPPFGGPPPGWTDCTARDDNLVSSTVTPRCDDLDDGGIYDGAV